MPVPAPAPSPTNRLTYDRLVVPLDGSERSAAAIEAADTLAAALGVAVTYLTVVASAAQLDARVLACTRFVPRDRLEAVVAHDVADAIVERAGGDGERALLCMASHGRGRVGGLMLGSVAEAVLRRGVGPLVLVGPRFDPSTFIRCDRLLVCVDGSKRSEQVLPVAARWARTLTSQLELITVLTPATHDDLFLTADGHLDVLDSGYVHRLARDLSGPGLDPQWEVLYGDAVRSIVDYGRRVPGTLIALSSHGRTGLDRLLMGSVAMRLIHHSPTPLLVIRSGPVDRA